MARAGLLQMTDNDSQNFRSRLANIPSIGEAPLPVGTFTDREPAPIEFEPDVTPELDPEPARRRRRRWPWVVAIVIVLIGVIAGLPLFLAWRTFNSIDRVPVGDSLATPVSGTNVLLVGTDSREGVDRTVENAGAIFDPVNEITGERSDTILILRIEDGGGSRMLSLPRDLWLPINGGGEQRINTALPSGGPEALIDTISTELGIPITTYMQIDIAGFIELVDDLGGVTVNFPYPAFDRASGLNQPNAGDIELDSSQALAYVRSRRYTEIIDGREVPDPTSDLGRVKRQQELLRALFSKLSGERNPLALNGMMSSIADSTVLDDQTSFRDALDIARHIRGGLPQSDTVPTASTSRNGNSVLVLTADADAVLALYRA